MATAFAFGSFVYSTNHCIVEGYSEEQSVREATAPVPRSHIAKARAGYRGPTKIQLEGVLYSSSLTTRSAFVAAVDALRTNHMGAGFQALRFDDGKYIEAECIALAISEDNQALNRARFTLRFHCPNPDWQVG